MHLPGPDQRHAWLPSPRLLERAVLAVAALLLLVHLLIRLGLIPTWTIDIGGVEGSVVLGVQRMLGGAALYNDPTRPPFDIVQYMPGYFAVVYGCAKLLGLGPLDVHAIFMLGRVLSLLFNFATVALVVSMATRSGVKPWLRYFIGGMVFCTFTWHLYGRPDSLSLMLVAAALRALQAYIANGHRLRRLLEAAVLAALAVVVKQSAVVVAGVVGLHLLLERRWRDLFIAVGVCGGTVGLVLLWMGPHYGADVLRSNLVDGLRNGTGLLMFRNIFLDVDYRNYIVYHVLGAWVVWGMLRGKAEWERAVARGAVLTIVFALVTGLKDGASFNYLLENFLLIYLAIGIFLSRPSPSPVRPALIGAFALYGLNLMLERDLQELGHLWTQRHSFTAADFDEARALAAELTNEGITGNGAYVFSMDRDPVEHFLVMGAVLRQKDIVHRRDGSWLFDYHRFVEDMDDGDVRYVVSRRPLARIAYLGRTFSHFGPAEMRHGYYVYPTTAGHR